MIGVVTRTAAFAVLLLAVALGSASAQSQQSQQRNQPGKFDFYVLSLSWSPSFCKDSEERGREANEQCRGRPYSFVVHGLWPQYERGFPRDCQVPAPRLNREIVGANLDLMPSPRLIFREWDRHGTCSGLSAHAYFDAVRKSRAVVKIPPEFLTPAESTSVAPDDIAAAFMRVNSGLSRQGLAVACDSTRLTEIRLCMTKDFAFRDCAGVASRACARDKIAMPILHADMNGMK